MSARTDGNHARPRRTAAARALAHLFLDTDVDEGRAGGMVVADQEQQDDGQGELDVLSSTVSSSAHCSKSDAFAASTLGLAHLEGAVNTRLDGQSSSMNTASTSTNTAHAHAHASDTSHVHARPHSLAAVMDKRCSSSLSTTTSTSSSSSTGTGAYFTPLDGASRSASRCTNDNMGTGNARFSVASNVSTACTSEDAHAGPARSASMRMGGVTKHDTDGETHGRGEQGLITEANKMQPLSATLPATASATASQRDRAAISTDARTPGSSTSSAATAMASPIAASTSQAATRPTTPSRSNSRLESPLPHSAISHTHTPTSERRSFFANILGRSPSSSSNHNAHARHASNPPPSSSSSIMNAASATHHQISTGRAPAHASVSQEALQAPWSAGVVQGTSPQTMITPASPAPFTKVDESQHQQQQQQQQQEKSLLAGSVLQRNSSSLSRASSFAGMRRSNSSYGPGNGASVAPSAPAAHDSVFANAQRAYLPSASTSSESLSANASRRSAERDDSVPSYERATSPLPTQATTPSSRAARLLSRHFASSGADSAQDVAGRRSPTPHSTPSRFFGGSNSSHARSGSVEVDASGSNTRLHKLVGDKATGDAKGKQKQQIDHGSERTYQQPPLSALNLELFPLSPQLSLSRHGQPLCGAVLDERYLLIGTSTGLDFLPLHREGNQSARSGLLSSVSASLAERFSSSSSSGPGVSGSHGASLWATNTANGTTSALGNLPNTPHVDEDISRKTRKPISLIKKTRFKQLVILADRSNVLLAVAGRNDHVRVYALDSLRRLIEKKMKEMDAKDGYVGGRNGQQGQMQGYGNRNVGLGITTPHAKAGKDVKGKGRARTTSNNAPPLPVLGGRLDGTQAGPSRSGANDVEQRSPPPAYDHPHAATSSSPSTSNQTTPQTAFESPSTASSSSFSYGPAESASVTEASNQRRRTSASSGSSSAQKRRQRAASIGKPPSTASSTSTFASSPPLREHIASSPRSMRRAKSRDVMWRPSTAGLGLQASAASAAASASAMPSSSGPNMARRGSAATVTPETIAALCGGAPTTASDSVPSSIVEQRRGSGASLTTTSAGAQLPATRTFSRRGSTAQLADMGQVTSETHSSQFLTFMAAQQSGSDEESYEWVDAPELDVLEDCQPGGTAAAAASGGYTFPPHPLVAPIRAAVPEVPPLPAQYATTLSQPTTPSSRSQYTTRLTPRSARAIAEHSASSDEEEEDQPVLHRGSEPFTYTDELSRAAEDAQIGLPAGLLSDDASHRSSSPLLPPRLSEEERAKQMKKNRRVSLAEILKESRVSPEEQQFVEATGSSAPSHLSARSARSPSTSTMQSTTSAPRMPRSASASIITSRSSRSGFTARAAAPTSTREDTASLMDFLNAGPPASTATSRNRPPPLQRSFTANSVPEMSQRQGQTSPTLAARFSPVQTLSKSPSLRSSATLMTPRSRMVPRDATVKEDPEEESGPGGMSFLDLLREGPPGPTVASAAQMSRSGALPAGLSRVPSNDANSTKSGQAERPRRLSKTQKRSTSSLHTAASSRAAGAYSTTSRPDGQVSSVTHERSLTQPGQAASHPPVPPHHTPRHRTRSDGAGQRRNGNFILPADETVPVPVHITAERTDKAKKRQSLQPRSPTFRQFITEVNVPPDVTAEAGAERTGTDSETGEGGQLQMPRSLSLQEMLASDTAHWSDGAPLGSSPEIDSVQPRSPTQTTARPRAVQSAELQQRNRRKRWSLLDGLRSSPTPGSTSAFPSQDEEANLAPNSFSSEIPQGAQAIDDDSQAPNRGMAGASARVSQDASQAMPLTQAAPPVLKPRPGQLLDDDSPPFGNLTPDLEQQAMNGSTHPDGTTITFTQRTSTSFQQFPNPGGLTSIASALNGAQTPQKGATDRPNVNGHMQKDPVSGNLDYVKLARTKGSRFIRASETSKRTYLAVLCGEQGERIELFTGAKNVSLSLNRTFVLPETPRTIEFQLQGEDLLDLYLIYDSAIFALEPSTVRVREVGIQRNERRQARRERERLLRQAAVLDNVDPASIMLPPSPAGRPRTTSHLSQSRVQALQQAGSEHIVAEASVPTASMAQGDAVPLAAPSSTVLDANGGHDGPARIVSRASSLRIPSREHASSASMENSPRSSSDIARAGALPTGPQGQRQHSRSETAQTDEMGVQSTISANNGSTGPPQPAVSTLSYTTFQQLEYLPNIPPLVLASSYIIPPTYESVQTMSPHPISSTLQAFPFPTAAQGLTMPQNVSQLVPSRPSTPSSLVATSVSAHRSVQAQAHGTASQVPTPPLLSPVSLLANPSAKHIGPPGLFFVSKGKHTTNIVDGDGRSVIRQPIAWMHPDAMPADVPEQYQGLDILSRMDIVLTSADKARVCVVAFGPTAVRATELGNPECDFGLEVAPFEVQKRQQKSRAQVIAYKAQGKTMPEDALFLRDVTYLAKDGERTFFAERLGSHVAVYTLASTVHY